FTATVNPVAPGAGTRTGTITFNVDGSPLTNVTVNGSGVATLATAALNVGSRTIGATYNGDSNFNGSVSTNITQTVNKANTSTGLSSSANPSYFGDLITFTATVTASATGAGTPTGTVTFKDSATTLGTGTLTAGLATFAISSLTVSNHSISTTYNGDGNFNTSTSGGLVETVRTA